MEPKTQPGVALKAAMQGCWGYDEAPDGDAFDAYALEAASQLLSAARNVVALPLEHDCNHGDVVWDLRAAINRYEAE